MLRLIFIGILLLLNACTSLVLLPSDQIVEKAIFIQVEQTQQELQEKLDLDFKKFAIQHLSITKKQPVTIGKLPSYHIQGNYDLTVQLPEKKLSQTQKPFDIYLQIQQEGKSWRLLIPENNNNQAKPSVWHSYLVL
ncbi:hypothetical protein WJM97_07475 [Okeanomitos corallinicola TIOX110]|uniref:Lipoprotein n=1 Tax=Okeanomitos corallinicola TIOX110 TaxID=3133117 RepID=A0ABZ2V147_9CYAN